MTAETYVNQIVKKVKCSRQKRADIRRQLLADVSAAMQQGETLKAVMLRMGEPIAIAEEFNENLPIQEHKKYKRNIAVKIVSATAATFTIFLLLAAWFVPRTAEIGSSGFYTEQAVEEKSKEIIRLLDEEDYEALLQCSNKKLRTMLTKEIIDDAKEQAGINWGRFLEFGKCYMQEVRQRGSTLAIAQINAAYENIGVTYTVMFDENMELTGLYIK